MFAVRVFRQQVSAHVDFRNDNPEEEFMKPHIRPISNPKLAFSQIEPLLQLVGLKQAIVGFPTVILNTASTLIGVLTQWHDFVDLKSGSST